MKKQVLMVLCLLLAASLFAQDIKSIKLEEYKLDSKITSTLVDKSKDEKLNIYQQNNEIYVLGWSKDGKMAYLENRCIEGRGGHDLLFTILDLVEDETVFNKKVSWYDDDDDGESPEKGMSFSDCIKNNSAEFNNELKKNGIILSPSKVMSFPFVDSKKNRYDFDITVIRKGIGEYNLIHMTYEIIARKNKNYKILNRVENKICSYALPTGYLKSPYENRIALIVASSEFVFEGDEVFVNFYGCNLNAGFNK